MKENTTMALKMNELLPFIKDLIMDFNDAKAVIANLTDANTAQASRITELEAVAAGEFALMEEAKGMIVSAREAPGGSTMGI
jgi:hypothetical protein